MLNGSFLMCASLTQPATQRCIAQASPKDFARLHSSLQNILTVHMDALKKKDRTKKLKPS
jgi:hypothetical protein